MTKRLPLKFGCRGLHHNRNQALPLVQLAIRTKLIICRRTLMDLGIMSDVCGVDIILSTDERKALWSFEVPTRRQHALILLRVVSEA